MYLPSDDVLKKYSDLLIKFALGGGAGIKKGEVVVITVPESAKAMVRFLRRSVLEAGGHTIFMNQFDTVGARDFYELANDEQLTFFPDKFYRGIVDQADHIVRILSEADKYELQGIDSQKLMMHSKAMKPYQDWRFEKEGKGKMTWTLASYGTEHEAKDAGMSHEEYWNQIIKACYLDMDDPIAKWKEIFHEQERLKKTLNDMKIEKVHVESENVDLWVQLGATRQWLGGSGRNIPSFEVFTSPDWRGTNGRIKFNVPLFRYGNKVSDIDVTFKDGEVVSASASENEQLLKDMLSVANANKIGEFSLTDKRMSRIDRFMGQTLYDENYGGEYGNTHVAFGMAYKDAYVGEVANTSKEKWDEMGFNDSAVHTDVFSIEDRTVTAVLSDGSQKVIYEKGQFTV
jgi:aminopeptidase